MPERLISALGAVVLLAVALATCPRALRSQIRWRTIGVGFAILLGTAALVLKTPASEVFSWANAGVMHMLDFSTKGAAFVFGPLVTDPRIGFVFAFQVLPSIVFFGAFMSVLYHLGVMPFLVRVLGRLIARSLGTSGAESFSTVADIFVGQIEAPLVIKPYVADLTLSELMACMTAGFATTAGGVLAGYVLMLKDLVPGIAGHLIASSVMCAPASLVVAKLMLPETMQPRTQGDHTVVTPRSATGFLDALTAGTIDGLRIAVSVGAMVISFLAFTALVDACLGWITAGFLATPLSLSRIFAWLFAPLAWLLGVSSADVSKVATLLGEKTVLNEFVAYASMSRELAADPAWLSERSRVIASYALCGFANFGSVGIQIGGYASLAPDRRADVARLAPRAMLAGLLTTCLVACVAGVFL